MTERSGRRKTDALAVVVIALCAAFGARPLFTPGWFDSHDGAQIIGRLLGVVQEMNGGDLYPRWLSLGYRTKGMPFFEFYAPGFYFSVGWLSLTGLPLLTSAKTVLVAIHTLGGIGAYVWTRRHLGPAAALVSAVLYVFAPYHFVDLYVRGALAEFTALAAIPFVFVGLDRARDRGWGGVAITAIALAAVVASHNLSLLLVAPFAALYVAAGFAMDRDRKALARTALGCALGAALSAFYWLPVIMERSALHDLSRTVASGYFDYRLHFVEPHQWIEAGWGFGRSVPGPADGMSFQLGIALVISASASAAIALSWSATRSERRFVLGSAALGLVGLLFTSASSAWWYDLVPPYRFVQFPWRFLGPTTLFMAAAGGGAIRALERVWPRARVPVVAAAVIAIGWSSLPYITIGGNLPLPAGAEEIAAVAVQGGGVDGLCEGDEYLPRWASPQLALASAGGGIVTPTGTTLSNLRAKPKSAAFDAMVTTSPATIVVPWHYFPGWKARADGRSIDVLPGPEGLIAFSLPPGVHHVEVWFGTTAPRVVGWIVTAFAGAAIALMSILARRSTPGAAAERRD